MRLRAPLGVIASLLCAPLACQAPPKQPPVGALIVRAPTAGVVSVRGRARALWPPSPARLEGLGPGPYDVTLNLDDSRVTILGVEGPEVDFSGLLGAPSPLKGPLMRLAVRVEGGAAVGIVGDRLIRPIDGALWVPEGAPLALIALWSGAEPPQAALRYIEAPSTFEGRQVYLTPAYALDDEVRLTLTGLDGAAVSAEIAFAGVRTGLIIGEGVVEGGRLRLPQLPAGIHEGLGLWLEARAPTWRGAAQAGAWIAAGARAATLEA
ncbi:hypothetical protein KKF91_13660, partial [Myxococcota bacterium]|nr:hypothetical protein [Myxococcota bacterium]